ncbi:glutamyl-tRNA reductase [Ignatzschineria sp. LJL83]
MSLLVLGIGHKTASVEIREQATLVPEKIRAFLTMAKSCQMAKEVVVLSTCNRTEFYFYDLTMPVDKFCAVWANYSELDAQTAKAHIYQKEGSEAAEHIFRVAAGLESLILGEPQIMGQLKDSLSVATEFGTAKKYLQRVLQMGFNVAKEIRTETNIGAFAVSVAFSAVQLARNIFDGLENQHVLLVGAGETIELVARHLIEAGVKNITIANRRIERASLLIDELGIQADAHSLADLEEILPKADIVVASTAAEDALITKEMAKKALKIRKNRPMLMIDLAVPRDISPAIDDLSNIYLYTVDNLNEIVEDNQKAREEAAIAAEAYIHKGLTRWDEWYKLAEIGGSVQAMVRYADAEKKEALHRLFNQLNGEYDPERIEKMATQLVNSLLHPMIEHLKTLEEAEEKLTITELLAQFKV